MVLVVWVGLCAILTSLVVGQFDSSAELAIGEYRMFRKQDVRKNDVWSRWVDSLHKICLLIIFNPVIRWNNLCEEIIIFLYYIQSLAVPTINHSNLLWNWLLTMNGPSKITFLPLCRSGSWNRTCYVGNFLWPCSFRYRIRQKYCFSSFLWLKNWWKKERTL